MATLGKLAGVTGVMASPVGLAGMMGDMAIPAGLAVPLGGRLLAT
jgi:hypothetical protein